MRSYWLKLTDMRLRAALNAVGRSGAGLGDLAAAPSGAPAFFRPLRAELDRAAASGGPNPGGSAALSAAEDFTLRLEKTFSDMALLDAPPDSPVKEALIHLAKACELAPALLSRNRRERALKETLGLSAGGRRALALARASVSRPANGPQPGGFAQNLKFSSIYSGLDSVFDALERLAEALVRI